MTPLADDMDAIRKRNEMRKTLIGATFHVENLAREAIEDVDLAMYHLEERLRVNVGLITESNSLKQRIAQLERGEGEAG